MLLSPLIIILLSVFDVPDASFIFDSSFCTYEYLFLVLALMQHPDNLRSHVHNQKEHQLLSTRLLHNIECLSLQWIPSSTSTANTHSWTLIPVLSSILGDWCSVAFWRGCRWARLALGAIIIESIIIITSLYYYNFFFLFSHK